MYLKVKFKCINTDISEGPDPQEWITLKSDGADDAPSGSMGVLSVNQSDQRRFEVGEEYLINISKVGDEAPEAPTRAEPPDVSA